MNNYKRCETSTSAYFPFGDDQVISAFDTTLKTDYQTALNDMIGFMNVFLDLSESVHKDANLVRAIVDLIQQDQSIKAGEEFYIGPNGEKKKKATLGDLHDVCLPSFLLGVWHYVVVNRKNNSVGKSTYNAWCPSVGGGQRRYTASMGSGILGDLKTYTVDAKEIVSTEIVDDPTDDESTGDAGQETPPVSQQIVNRNPTFFNFNISGGNNNFHNHVDKLTINNGGKIDE